jgi:hypothetical protein
VWENLLASRRRICRLEAPSIRSDRGKIGMSIIDAPLCQAIRIKLLIATDLPILTSPSVGSVTDEGERMSSSTSDVPLAKEGVGRGDGVDRGANESMKE